MKTSRRDFLKGGAGAVAAISGVSGIGEGTAAPAGEAPGMIYRKFGSTGAQISAIGVDGHRLGDVPTLDAAVQLIHEAIDAGVTFFDNAWEYYNGKTETMLGRALRGGRREKVFLMTKVCTHGRSGKLAMQMLEDSLRRYQTDHLDLWQIHGIVYDNDPELAYPKGGVLEAFDQAKKEGKSDSLASPVTRIPHFISRCSNSVIHLTQCRCRSIPSTPTTIALRSRSCPR
jgi:hypothetical protein